MPRMLSRRLVWLLPAVVQFGASQSSARATRHTACTRKVVPGCHGRRLRRVRYSAISTPSRQLQRNQAEARGAREDRCPVCGREFHSDNPTDRDNNHIAGPRATLSAPKVCPAASFSGHQPGFRTNIQLARWRAGCLPTTCLLSVLNFGLEFALMTVPHVGDHVISRAVRTRTRGGWHCRVCRHPPPRPGHGGRMVAGAADWRATTINTAAHPGEPVDVSGFCGGSAFEYWKAPGATRRPRTPNRSHVDC